MAQTKLKADTQLASKHVSTEDCKTIISFMRAQGISLRAACAQLQFNQSNVQNMIFQTPELRALDSEARAAYMREKVREMNMIATLTEDPQRARLLCDNIKWEASRIMRSEFGDHVTVAGDKENPLTVQLVAAGDDLVKRIRQGITIDHEAIQPKN